MAKVGYLVPYPNKQGRLLNVQDGSVRVSQVTRVVAHQARDTSHVDGIDRWWGSSVSCRDGGVATPGPFPSDHGTRRDAARRPVAAGCVFHAQLEPRLHSCGPVLTVGGVKLEASPWWLLQDSCRCGGRSDLTAVFLTRAALCWLRLFPPGEDAKPRL